MGSKTLIAVKSCHRDLAGGYHDSILNTWGQDVRPADLNFFIGEGFAPGEKIPLGHYICLPCKDDYDSLPAKTWAILRWSLAHDYDFTFLCDTDTFVIPARLLNTGYTNFDYAGRFGNMPAIGTTFRYRDPRQTVEVCHPWASGGIGYFLSRKAAEYVVQSTFSHWAEDLSVGQALGPLVQSGEIKAFDLPIECDSAWHFPRRAYGNQIYDPKFRWMENMYASEEFRAGKGLRTCS